MRLHYLTLEFYYSEAATGYSGAVDHIAIDCTNVDALYEQAKKDHLTIVETGELPYWDNGVKYFTITGPNQEKIEFSQYL